VRITLHTLQKMAREGDKIAVLTCYDASFATLLEQAGVECLLIGDSLGMVVQGHESTLPVSMEHMVYHTRCVAQGSRRAFLIADMPFGSFQVSPAQAFENAARLMAAGAHMVKIEGGAEMAGTVEFLTRRGIPVCGHVGLTPQSVHQLGGYRVQGKTEDAAERLRSDVGALEQAGAGLIVLEAIPSSLAARVTAEFSVPTIGIGAGPDCSGQVLVLYDMLEIYPGRKARFVKNFLRETSSIEKAVESFVREVKAKTFPGPEHCF
jgi:3-methyl-2-oxobutanoate hydroxymethyltransferase